MVRAMDDKHPNTELSERLQNSEGDIDQATLDKLKAIRQKALKTPPADSEDSGHWQGWLLAATVAMLAVLIALPQIDSNGGSVENIAALEEGPQDDIDLYENLEFYEWLAAEEGDLG